MFQTRVSAMMNNQLESCPTQVAKFLKNRLKDRYFMFDSKPVELLLQIFTSSSVNLNVTHSEQKVSNFVKYLHKLGKGYPLVKSLKSEKMLTRSHVREWFVLFPNLRTFIFAVDTFNSYDFDYIRTKYPQSREIRIDIKFVMGNIEDDVCKFLFCGRSIEYVRNCYIKGENLDISFRNLTFLMINLKADQNTSFLRLLVHFYPNCNMDWGEGPPASGVTTFDSLISYSIDLNPCHALAQCSLNYTDLRFPYTQEIISNWTNLKTLYLYFGSSDITLDFEQCSATFLHIVLESKNLDYLNLLFPTLHPRIYSCYQSILKTFPLCEHKFSKLKILDYVGFFSGLELIILVNLFSRLTHLTIQNPWRFMT